MSHKKRRIARLHSWDQKTFVKALIASFVIELITLTPTLLTMGHAGPEGRLSELGWLGILINLPGILLVRALGLSETSSVLVIGLYVFLIQTALFTYIIFLLLRLKQRKGVQQHDEVG